MEDYVYRCPSSLQNLCRDKLVKLVVEATQRIQERTNTIGNERSKIAQWFPFVYMEDKTFRRHIVRQIQSSLSSLPSQLFNWVALSLYSKDSDCVEVLLHPLLRTLEVNSKSLSCVLDQAYQLTGVTTLYLFFDINRHLTLAPKLYSFVASLSRLTHLKVSNCVTDHLLGVLGLNCPHLTILDAEEDSEMTVTDHGLAFLTNCKKLQRVILNDAGDEYDYEDRYFGVTGKAIANLIISLPRLTHLVCEPYLLREALDFVHEVSLGGDTSFDLRYLHVKFANAALIQNIKKICPKLDELVLEDPHREAVESLPGLGSLTCLHLENFTWTLFQEEAAFSPVLGRLQRLSLKNPKQALVDAQWLLKMGQACSKLKSLALTLYQPDAFTRVVPFDKKKVAFFPALESLIFDGDLSTDFIESLLISVKELKKLTIYRHDLGYPTGEFDSMMLRLSRSGCLRHLTHLTCFQWPVSLETMLFLIDQCPKLRVIYGLDLLMLCPNSIALIQSHIQRNNRAIDLFEASSTLSSSSSPWHAECPPKGIPFLSEHSRHRVEAADHAGCSADERFERILQHGTLEDLLKEMYLL